MQINGKGTYVKSVQDCRSRLFVWQLTHIHENGNQQLYTGSSSPKDEENSAQLNNN